MQCPSCGTEIQPGDAECPTCGIPTALSGDTLPASMQSDDPEPYDVESIPYIAD